MTTNNKTSHCTIKSRMDNLHCADALTEKIADQLSLNEDQKNNLAIAVTEAVGNAIIHGNKKNPNKKVFIQFKTSKKKIEVIIRDEGEGFNPNDIADPLLPENLMKESGRGVFILKELMDEVEFNFSKNGTTLKMIMNI